MTKSESLILFLLIMLWIVYEIAIQATMGY